MKNNDLKSSGWRGSKQLWIDEALRALIAGGVSAVKIQPLASKLSLSRTSFYWFFKDRKELLSELLNQWESLNTNGLISASQSPAASPSQAVLNVLSAFLDDSVFDSQLDFAVRGWALQDSQTMLRVNKTDERRMTALKEMLRNHCYSNQEADIRARTIYLVQIGYISMQVQETLATRMSRIPGYIKTYTGYSASEAEMQQFYARHNYSAE